MTETLIAYHGKASVKPQDFIRQALFAGTLKVNAEDGLVFTRRGAMKCVSVRGYIVGTVHHNGARKQVKAHQVIWISQGLHIQTGFVLDHINRDKKDNRLSNLQLVRPLENSRNRRSYTGAGNPAAKLDAATAASIRLHHKSSRSYLVTSQKFGVSKSLVAQIIRGELWKS